MTDRNNVPEAGILTPEECWALLAETGVGRLAVIAGGHPDVFPVNYKVDGRTLVFRTGRRFTVTAPLMWRTSLDDATRAGFE